MADMEMTTTEGEKEYAQGGRHFQEMLHNHSRLSWAQALNSLQAAALSPDLDRCKVADANYKLGLLFIFDSNYRRALYYFETCLRIERAAFVHAAIGVAYHGTDQVPISLAGSGT